MIHSKKVLLGCSDCKYDVIGEH